MSGKPIFKKSSPNGKLTCYLAKRDYFDDLQRMEVIDGVVLVDHGISQDKRVFAHIKCEYRYGSGENDNVMSGVTFKKDFFFAAMQVYPPDNSGKQQLTPLQASLTGKFPNSHPFSFQLPHDIPPSIMIQSTAASNGAQEAEPCGVEYSVQLFIARRKDEEPLRNSSVRMAIRRLTCAQPRLHEPPPIQEISKGFHLHSGNVRLEVSLSKEVYYHGEPVNINIVIDNYSSNVVKGMTVKVLQLIEITLFKEKAMKNVICSETIERGFPLGPGQAGWNESLRMRPSLAENRSKAGLALDGKMKYQDTNLASSTLIRDFRNKENIGIVVQYVVKARVFTGFGGRDASLEVPFILTHPKPAEGSTEAKKNDEVVFEHFSRMKQITKQDTMAETLD